jgi:uncharacterized membrane protein (UPF0127 family)
VSEPTPDGSPDGPGEDRADSAEAREAGRGWLVREGEVLASVEIADTRRERFTGLLGRERLEGALVLPGIRSVHSFGMHFDLDVAFVDADNIVVRTLLLKRNRITLPVWRAHLVVEAEAGSFGHWELKIGDKVEVRHP